ncbi:glutathione-dependent formaldehyde-activating, GFA [Luminiphilus syltensis NOR5-1B]|uniref:Glutathione-dependent formaldehyde-activating, GFA n=1 Tax=Luminiphilus syltensis NOR5-1B TaxID=565045 RepID=B8KXV3_9GAMM|nr:glutathione-dependent formaldehyde-activating, GFA [Luminiphilus syltensis NOR5-1B]
MAYTASQPSIYSSSPGVGRAFCGHCGTPLTWEGDGGEIGPLVELYTGTLDNPEAFPPEQHIHHREHLSWFETLDRLPRYSEWHDDGESPYQYGPVAGEGEGEERESGEEE